MRFLSLFSGIEAASAAWVPLGWECAGVAEVDPFCCALLAERYPGVPNLGDVRDLRSSGELDESVRTFYCDPSTPEEVAMAGQLKKLTKEQAAESVRMYESGLSLAPIAKYFGVSRQAMWDLLRRRTTLRPQRREGEDSHFHRGGSRADAEAHNLVETAISQGVLQRKTHCEECGSTGAFRDGRTKIQAHHDDYNKPLSVRWLCQKCHHRWHSKNVPVRKEVLVELPKNVDVVVGGFP